jgi:hypothetical protein
MKAHWDGYVNALGKNPKPTSSNSIPFETTSSAKGVSGFLDLQPKQPKIQAKYDAMSGSWEGILASEQNVLKIKADKTEFMNWKK